MICGRARHFKWQSNNLEAGVGKRGLVTWCDGEGLLRRLEEMLKCWKEVAEQAWATPPCSTSMSFRNF